MEAVEGLSARCAIVSPYLDPLSKRDPRPHRFVALGLKPGDSPTRLRFVTKPDKGPAAGFTLTARLVPDGQPRELGTTDRSGRILLKPGFADGLVIIRLLAGYIEPLVELPLMPGESADEQEISIDPLPLTVALETQIDALRDEVIDLVAIRARLESRMKARLDGEDWKGLEEAVKEFSKLPPRDEFAQKLTKLKDEATTAAGRDEETHPDADRAGSDQRPSVTHRSLSRRRRLQSLCRRGRTKQRRRPLPRRKGRRRSPANQKPRRQSPGRPHRHPPGLTESTGTCGGRNASADTATAGAQGCTQEQYSVLIAICGGRYLGTVFSRRCGAFGHHAHVGLIAFPPAVIVNTVAPLSTSPEPLVTPGKTLSWPPFGNDWPLVSFSVTTSLAGV